MKIKINSQGLRRSLRGFCALLVLAFLITCTGRGVDVGNPVQGFAIQGFVYTPDNNPARKAQVILGIARENELDTIFQEGACNNNCTQFVAYQYLLDTVQADDDGWFIFENKTPAEYVLVANSDSLSSYRRIEHKSQITDIDINLSPSHDITFGTGYFESEGKSLKFFVIQNTNAASFEPLTGLDMVMEDSSLDEFLLDFRIKGTSVRADEVNGLFTLNQAPQGVFDLVVFDTDSNRFEIPYNNNGFGCEIYLADEALVLDQENIEYPLSDYSGAIQLEKWVSRVAD